MAIERYLPGSVEAADSRRAYAQAATSYRKRHDQLPADGYVIFWHGQAEGWTASVSERPNGLLKDSLAFPSEPGGTIYVARGGTYMDGAERWEALPQ